MFQQTRRSFRVLAALSRSSKSSAHESVAFCALAVSLAALPAYAAPQAKQVPTVRLTAPQTLPGGETFVTILLENAPSEPLQSFNTEIEFDLGALTYVASRLALAGDLARAELDVSVHNVESTEVGTGAAPAGGQPATKTARLAVVVKGAKPVPNGPVVEIRFRVAQGLDGHTLKLEQRAEAFAPGGEKLANLVAPPGEIRITSADAPKVPMVMACFFYMH